MVAILITPKHTHHFRKVQHKICQLCQINFVCHFLNEGQLGVIIYSVSFEILQRHPLPRGQTPLLKQSNCTGFCELSQLTLYGLCIS